MSNSQINKKMKKTIGLTLILLVMTGQIVYGQTNEEKAFAKVQQAVQLTHSGRFNESIELLKEAQKLDPERLDWTYELALVHHFKGDYEVAIEILRKHLDHKDVTDRFFQIIGASYDVLEKPENALKYIDLGLERFPNSGILYLTKGIVYERMNKINEALFSYEKGIEVDPAFPSNYYRAALVFLELTTEKVWGMIYGEIFMNLERNSQRTIDMSRLLFDTYKSQINFMDDNSISVSFSRSSFLDLSSLLGGGELKLPFGVGIYEPTLLLSIIGTREITLHTLNNIRTSFVDNYFRMGHDKTFPNVLFSYQKKVKDVDHFEAYNYWILMKGDEDEFDEWYWENEEKWESFVEWFTENGLQINDTNKFFRGQY
jgi:tetratricopeptide (TPR) repeat protein